MGDVTSPLCTGPDIATDAEEAAPAWIVALPAQIFSTRVQNLGKKVSTGTAGLCLPF